MAKKKCPNCGSRNVEEDSCDGNDFYVCRECGCEFDEKGREV